MSKITGDVGKALTRKSVPPSSFSPEGDFASKITITGVHWRLMLMRQKRNQEFYERAKERAKILGKDTIDPILIEAYARRKMR